MIAVPSDPPTRCRTVSCGLASLTCSRPSTANAAVMAGMIDRPMPTPRTSIAAPIVTYGVVAVISTNGIVAATSTNPPISDVRPGAEALGGAAGQRHPDRTADALGDEQQAGGQRALAAHRLEVERHQDHRPEQRGAEAEGDERRGAEGAVSRTG